MILLEIWMTENVFSGLLPRLVETIHIKLPDEAIDIFVPKIFGKDGLFELFYIFDCEFFSIG